MEQTTYLRTVAKKLYIQDILHANYVQENESMPNYLQLGERKIYRVNLFGIVVDKDTMGSITNIHIDDGTGTLVLRFFEENKALHAINLGDAVLCIGKVRIYNQEKYVSPEIIKKIDKHWLAHRQREIPKKNYPKQTPPQKEPKEDDVENDGVLPVEKMTHLIKELDQGTGVLIEEVIQQSTIPQAEQIIELMLEKGEIFQIAPGKVKVL